MKPTIHGLRRPRASEIAPSTGIESATSSDATPFATAYAEFDAPRSEMSHTEKYSVATFIDQIVFAKS